MLTRCLVLVLFGGASCQQDTQQVEYLYELGLDVFDVKKSVAQKEAVPLARNCKQPNPSAEVSAECERTFLGYGAVEMAYVELDIGTPSKLIINNLGGWNGVDKYSASGGANADGWPIFQNNNGITVQFDGGLKCPTDKTPSNQDETCLPPVGYSCDTIATARPLPTETPEEMRFVDVGFGRTKSVNPPNEDLKFREIMAVLRNFIICDSFDRTLRNGKKPDAASTSDLFKARGGCSRSYIPYNNEQNGFSIIAPKVTGSGDGGSTCPLAVSGDVAVTVFDAVAPGSDSKAEFLQINVQPSLATEIAFPSSPSEGVSQTSDYFSISFYDQWSTSPTDDCVPELYIDADNSYNSVSPPLHKSVFADYPDPNNKKLTWHSAEILSNNMDESIRLYRDQGGPLVDCYSVTRRQRLEVLKRQKRTQFRYIEIPQFYLTFYDFDQGFADGPWGKTREQLTMFNAELVILKSNKMDGVLPEYQDPYLMPTELEGEYLNPRSFQKQSHKLKFGTVERLNMDITTAGAGSNPQLGDIHYVEVLSWYTAEGTEYIHPQAKWCMCQGGCNGDAPNRYSDNPSSCPIKPDYSSKYVTARDKTEEPAAGLPADSECYGSNPRSQCTRTLLADDDGNPKQASALTDLSPQQLSRAALFRFKDLAGVIFGMAIFPGEDAWKEGLVREDQKNYNMFFKATDVPGSSRFQRMAAFRMSMEYPEQLVQPSAEANRDVYCESRTKDDVMCNDQQPAEQRSQSNTPADREYWSEYINLSGRNFLVSGVFPINRPPPSSPVSPPPSPLLPPPQCTEFNRNNPDYQQCCNVCIEQQQSRQDCIRDWTSPHEGWCTSYNSPQEAFMCQGKQNVNAADCSIRCGDRSRPPTECGNCWRWMDFCESVKNTKICCDPPPVSPPPPPESPPPKPPPSTPPPLPPPETCDEFNEKEERWQSCCKECLVVQNENLKACATYDAASGFPDQWCKTYAPITGGDMEATRLNQMCAGDRCEETCVFKPHFGRDDPACYACYKYKKDCEIVKKGDPHKCCSWDTESTRAVGGLRGPQGKAGGPQGKAGASARKDPHLTFAHGGKADFKGENNTIYNMLSARNLSVNVRFMYDDFVLPRRLVHGSYMQAIYMTIRSYCPSCASSWGNVKAIRDFNIEYTANGGQAVVRQVGTGSAHNKKWVVDDSSGQLKFGNVLISCPKRHMVEVTDGRWTITAVDKEFPNPSANPGKKLLHVKLEPAAGYNVDHDPTSPHGIIGQSYDGDDVGVSGAEDDYRKAAVEMSTTAQAEGAIEGTYEDYKMEDPFSTDFKYSRYDQVQASRRDVKSLSGVRVKADPTKVSNVAGAVTNEGDVAV